MSNIFAEFLVNAGLYERIEVTRSNSLFLSEVIDGKVKIDVYCKECGKPRVFTMRPITILRKSDSGELAPYPLGNILNSEHYAFLRPNEAGLHSNSPGENPRTSEWHFAGYQTKDAVQLLDFQFYCTSNPLHRLDFLARIIDNTMIKVGQFPSIADLAFPEVDEFKKVTDDTSRKEIRRAIGLHAQGIGVGSYVYLRRILERILEEAKGHAERDGDLDLSQYSTMKVQDRMRLLRAYLPEMINANPVFYGIVSKGIHELSEEDCIKYFPVLKEAIFMILRQWNHKRQELEAAKRLTSALSGISAELKSDKK